MTRIVSIVEGHGEVAALPILLRRINDWLAPTTRVETATPIRVKRDRFLNREEEFSRFLNLASSKCGNDGWIIVLLDADDDCPATLALQIGKRARALLSHRNLSIILANREFEAWFIAAASSLAGCRGFHAPEEAVLDPEALRDAKGWISQRMLGSYGETTDQPAFTAQFSLEAAYLSSRSFRKFCDEWKKQHAAIVASEAPSD